MSGTGTPIQQNSVYDPVNNVSLVGGGGGIGAQPNYNNVIGAGQPTPGNAVQLTSQTPSIASPSTLPPGGLIQTNLGSPVALPSGSTTLKPGESVQDQALTVLKGTPGTKGLLQQAEAAGLQIANKRGLINSSLAAGAAQGEAYKVAIPIAQQNAAQQFNRGQADEQFRQSSFLSGQDALQRSGLSRQEAGQQSALTKQQHDFQAELARFNATSAKDLADLEARNRTLITVNEQAAARYNNLQQQISDILRDPNMTATSKTSAINILQTYSQSYFDLLKSLGSAGGLNGVEFGRIPSVRVTEDGLAVASALAQGGGTGGGTGAPATPAPAPAPAPAPTPNAPAPQAPQMTLPQFTAAGGQVPTGAVPTSPSTSLLSNGSTYRIPTGVQAGSYQVPTNVSRSGSYTTTRDGRFIPIEDFDPSTGMQRR